MPRRRSSAVPWIGIAQTQVFYDRGDRQAGETHYPLPKMLALAFDGIASMSTAPLRLAYLLCLLLFSVFIGYIMWVLFDHFVYGSELVQGWTSLMSARPASLTWWRPRCNLYRQSSMGLAWRWSSRSHQPGPVTPPRWRSSTLGATRS